MSWSYSNTNGSGNRTGGGGITVTTTATLSAGVVNDLIDGSTANSFVFTNGESSKEIKFDFGTGRTIRQARWKQSSTSTHGTWKWRGSNDDSSYTDIGVAFTLGGVNGTHIHVQLIANTTSYRYYKLAQQTGTTSSSPFIQEVEFFIDGGTDEEGDTSYAYPLGGSTNGTGVVAISGGDATDRNSHITLTSSGTLNPGPITNLVDGAVGNNSTDSIGMPNAISNEVLKFQFDVAQRCTAITWEQQNSTAQGTYTMAGSNDDSSYTDLATGLVLVNGSSFNENTFTNTASYLYYRLTQTAGTTSSSPWCHEIYFKLVPKTTGATSSYDVDVTEAATATDTVSTANAAAGSITETATATDTVSTANAAAGSVTETATATDVVSAGLIPVPRAVIIVICG